MSTAVRTSRGSTRKRNAAATRTALLEAARELFGAKGFEQTTLRDIGERAGADPALISRYFGNKVALYLATMAADEPFFDDRQPPSMVRLVRRAIQRADSTGAGPLIQATIQPDADQDVRQAALEHWTARVLGPLADRLRAGGITHAELRAELITSMMIGAVVVRSGGVMPAISDAGGEELTRELSMLLDRLLEP